MPSQSKSGSRHCEKNARREVPGPAVASHVEASSGAARLQTGAGDALAGRRSMAGVKGSEASVTGEGGNARAPCVGAPQRRSELTGVLPKDVQRWR